MLLGFLKYSEKRFEHRSRSQYLLQMVGIELEMILCGPGFKDKATQLVERDVPSTDLVELFGDAKEVAEELEVLDGVDLLGELLLHLGIRLLAKLLVQSFSHSMLDLSGLLLAVKAVPDILVCLLI